MANLQKIIKVTQAQYNTLAEGGTVGDYTGLDPNFLYLIKDTNTYITSDGGTINGILKINGKNQIRNTSDDPLEIFYDNSNAYAIALYPDINATEYYYGIDVEDDEGAYNLTLPAETGTLATRNYVAQYVGKPMVFQGTVGTGGTVTWANLPTASNSNKGYTYKVITDHAADSKCPACKVGDTIISNGSAWVVIPSGDEDTDTVREIKVNGATQLNTGISSGYVNFKNGTNTTVSFSNSHDIQINATDTNTQYQLKTYDATATGRIAYLSDASSSGSNTVSKSTHTHTVTATGSVSLGSSTSTDGVKYVESVTSNPAGEEGKYMHFSAGTTPPSAATPNTTSTTSGANSGTKVTAVTGYPNFNGGGSGGKYMHWSAGTTPKSGATPNATSTNTGTATVATGGTTKYFTVSRGTSGSGTTARRTLSFSAANSSTTSGAAMNMTYIESVSTGTHSHTYDKTTSVSLTNGTAPSLTFDSTASGGEYYLNSHTNASLGTPSTGDCAPNAHTHSYDKTTSVSLTAGNAPSMTYNTTASGGEYYVTNVTGGGATPTTKYFHPSFSGTSATTSDGSNATATASTGVSKTTKYLNLEEK